MPFFSIVIPAYNRQEFIVATIDSVLSQSYVDFEILVVDDGSADSFFKFMEINFGSNPKIRIIRQENKERGAARNNGFRNSKGEYVVFLDSDDIMRPDHLEVLHQKIIIENYPNFIAAKFVLQRGSKTTQSDLSHLNEGYYDYHLFLNGNPLACNVSVKRKNENLKLFEEDRRYAIKEDWMFLLQNLRNDKLLLIDRVTITMIDHEDRSMRSDQNKIIQKTFLSLEWIKKNIAFNEDDLKTLRAHANYFSAIHSYIDFKRMNALKYLWSAILLKGLKKKYILLAAKAVVGRKLIGKIAS